MQGRAILLLLTAAQFTQADERTRKLALRLTEEATLFAHEAIKVVGTETLKQHALTDAPVGNSKITARFQDRTIVSQYSFVSFREAPEALRELRQIETIDGKPAKSQKSLKAVAAAVLAADERQKRKLLEEFQKAGLLGVATDLGQLLLLFSGRKIQNYDFSFQSQRFVGSDRVMVFSYAQTEGGGMTVYHGKDTMRPKLNGDIWVDGNYRPLKITLNSNADTPDRKSIRQEIEVSYSAGVFPCVLPTRAKHRELRDAILQVENEYTYTGFHLWEEERK